jgi:hypothetical protein
VPPVRVQARQLHLHLVQTSVRVGGVFSRADQAVHEGALARGFCLRVYDRALQLGELLLLWALVFGHGFRSVRRFGERRAVEQVPCAQPVLCGNAALFRPPAAEPIYSAMARIATIQLKVLGTIVQTIPLEDADVTSILAALQNADDGLPNRARLIDLFEQLAKRRQATASG